MPVSDRKSEMNRRERKEWVEHRLAEMRDLANGVNGSDGTVSLSPDHSEVFVDELGGEIVEELGGGGCMVSCKELCEKVLEGDAVEPEAAPARRRKPKKEEKAGSDEPGE